MQRRLIGFIGATDGVGEIGLESDYTQGVTVVFGLASFGISALGDV